MKKKLKKVIFFGTEDFSLKALESLVEAGYNVCLVVTRPDSIRGRGKTLEAPAVKKFASQNQIEVVQPTKLTEVADKLRSCSAPLAVLSSYGKIIPREILDIFPLGIVNVHPSLLPKYRGPSPIETAILSGDTTTGVTIMRLVEEMDAGPIYTQAKIHLDGSETAPELYDKLGDLGSRLLLDSLESIAEQDLEPAPQDESQASYCRLLSKDDSRLDPNLKTAIELDRQVRAYLKYPKSRLEVCGHESIITKATFGNTPQTKIDQRCKDGKFLIIKNLIAPSGREMDARAFINGYCAGESA